MACGNLRFELKNMVKERKICDRAWMLLSIHDVLDPFFVPFLLQNKAS
jgi:hypothetical protein